MQSKLARKYWFHAASRKRSEACFDSNSTSLSESAGNTPGVSRSISFGVEALRPPRPQQWTCRAAAQRTRVSRLCRTFVLRAPEARCCPATRYPRYLEISKSSLLFLTGMDRHPGTGLGQGESVERLHLSARSAVDRGLCRSPLTCMRLALTSNPHHASSWNAGPRTAHDLHVSCLVLLPG